MALVIDVRGQDVFGQLSSVFRTMDDSGGFNYKVLFLEASDETLVNRFKASRRPHPLAPEGGILDGLKLERQLLARLRAGGLHW